MVRQTLLTISAAVAASVLAGAALAHPGGGRAGGGGGSGSPSGAAAMGHFSDSSLGPGGGAGNFGANGLGGPPTLADRGAAGNFGQAHAAAVGLERRSSFTSGSTPAALDNPRLDTALTRALAKSGVALPPGGLKSACAGFGSVGQCVAALHVSQNLDIPGGFEALKAAAIAPNSSLGKAIHQLRPRQDAQAAEREAGRQADADLGSAKG